MDEYRPVAGQPHEGSPQYGASPQPGYQGYGAGGHEGYYPRPERRGTRKKKSGGAFCTALTALVAGLLGALLVLLAMPAIFGVNPVDLVRGKLRNTSGLTQTAGPRTNVKASPSQGATDVSGIAKAVTPSIVNIDVKSRPAGNSFMPTQAQEGTGSGVIVSPDGYIMTNNHVVEGATDVNVTFASGEEAPAKLVGADPRNDVAVVKVEKSGLPAIAIGDSDALEVGELVVAVGSPLGFEQTVTSGIVSALHRTVAAQDASGGSSVLTDLIQTDASINPGNSGGALCDSESRLIGINAIIASQSGGSEGIGFAIPINTAKEVADDLIAGKDVSHPYIGIQGQTVSADVADQYNLPVTKGAYVTRVVPGGPAEKAGISSGDIIVSIDGKAIESMDDVIAAVRSKEVGDKVSVTYYEGSGKKTVDLTVQEEPDNLS